MGCELVLQKQVTGVIMYAPGNQCDSLLVINAKNVDFSCQTPNAFFPISQ